MNITSTSTTSSPVTFNTTAARMSGGAKPAAASSSSSSSTKTYDKKDTNKDGTVSAYEELVYDMKHPATQDNDGNGTRTGAQVGALVDAQA
jgi:hypothetical protein